MRIGNIVRWAIAVGLLGLSFVNASWLAPEPAGALKLIGAQVGGEDDCATLDATRRALIAGGGPVVLDIDTKPGCMPATTALAELARYSFIMRTTDGEKALAVFDSIKRPIDDRYAFLGDAAAISAIRAREPNAWAFTIAEGRQCFADYTKLGWLSLVPASCKGKTILVPLDQKWKIAGWPRRFQARMAAADTRIILTAPGEPTDSIPGIAQLEQIPEIPRAYTGFAWVDDVGLIGPSIRR
jgi:hypothetical protein